MKKYFSNIYMWLIFTWLYLPILVLILYSFNHSKYSMQWHGFTWQWYKELFADRSLWQAFIHSAVLGVFSSVLATLICMLAVVQLFVNLNKHNSKLQLIILTSIMVPDLVLGVSLLVFFNNARIPLGFMSLLITHVTFCIPFSLITLQSHMRTLDQNVYFSALDLGATKLRAFFTVIIPMAAPAILSSILLSFTLSFDDVLTSYFVAGPEYAILPLTIYSLVRSGITPELNALCCITLFLSFFLVIISNRLTGKLL